MAVSSDIHESIISVRHSFITRLKRILLPALSSFLNAAGGRIAAVLCVMAVSFPLSIGAEACTAAVIGAEASASGRPLLWKHRDTSTTDNKIEFVEGSDGEFSYVALFNAKDRALKEAWIGMNEMGFAVMNTASYNLKDDRVPKRDMDKEGFLMTIALKNCRTVDDFEKLLSELPRPMGVEANFGVIDALGGAAMFETNNHSFIRTNASDSPGDVIIRTNYSHSGRPNEGYGFVREANAEYLLEDVVARGEVTPEYLTETVSRSFYHDLRKEDALLSGKRWIVDEDFIPRYKSTATIVVEGILPLRKESEIDPSEIVSQYIMWTGLGYPPCSEIYPVWCHKNGIEEGLRGIGPDGTSPIGNEAKKRRAEVFPHRRGGNTKYIDTEALRNDRGTGYLQVIPPRNHATYELITRKRDNGEIEF